MGNTYDVLTDEKINQAWGNANFGDRSKRSIIANALLKYACGYATGHTVMQICTELGLIGKTQRLTKQGKQYLWEYYSNGVSV